MNLPFYIASRYLVAKKSHNAINIISFISVMGVMMGTMALIVILSVFNGFDSLVRSLINSFNPDLKIMVTKASHLFPIRLRWIRSARSPVCTISAWCWKTRPWYGTTSNKPLPW